MGVMASLDAAGKKTDLTVMLLKISRLKQANMSAFFLIIFVGTLFSWWLVFLASTLLIPSRTYL